MGFCSMTTRLLPSTDQAPLSGELWLDACNAPNSAALSDSGIRVRQFAGLTLFWSAANDATALVQAEAIFHWVSLFRPQAGDSLDLLEALAGSRPAGKNVLPAPGVTPAERAQAPWAFGQGAEFQPATAAMVLHAAGPMVNATVNYSVTPQSKYILSFWNIVNADFQGAGSLRFCSRHAREMVKHLPNRRRVSMCCGNAME